MTIRQQTLYEIGNQDSKGKTHPENSYLDFFWLIPLMMSSSSAPSANVSSGLPPPPPVNAPVSSGTGTGTAPAPASALPASLRERLSA